MASIETIFSAIENAYRRTENKIMSLAIDNSKRERIVAQCMELFRPLYLDQPSMTGLEAYFRYLVHDASTLSDVPFNFLLTEDEKTDRIIQTFLDALKLITGEEQNARSVDEQQLLFHCEEELSKLGGCSVYIIKNCSSAPMTSDDRIAWNVVAGLFELTPRIVKILCASKEVIETRFREVDHIYYRVFRNSIRTREATPTEVSNALLDNLDERGFNFSQAFLDEIRLYVDTVYPKADLKEDRFVNDLVERVVHRYYEKKRSGMELDEECVPFYFRGNDKSAHTQDNLSIEKVDEVSEIANQNKEYDKLVDEYATAKKPVIKNILIVSLSTFSYSKTLSKYTYRYGDSDVLEPEYGTYYYQQEPFPMRLKEQLKDSGEILMLATHETLEIVDKTIEGEPFRKSPQAYFMEAARHIPGLENVLFKSVELNPNDPIDAVSKVVAHLREIKDHNAGLEFQIYLGTNGGLRGNQLILEAILSLLTADMITVSPEHVWSMKGTGKEFELFNSAAEFKIFDFVSGINEFLNYGRVDSLQAFLRANQDVENTRTSGLLECIEEIAEGIQYCSIKAFETGLNRLADYFNEETGSENMYIEMFLSNIRNDYGALLSPERGVLDEIKWCIKKGFYQQAFALMESALPRVYIQKKVIECDVDTYNAVVNRFKGKNEDALNYIFNKAVMWHVDRITPDPDHSRHNNGWRPDDWSKNQKITWDDDEVRITVCSNFNMNKKIRTDVKNFRDLLKSHFDLKENRNGLFHVGESETTSTKMYYSIMTEYVKRLDKFYRAWKEMQTPEPLLEIKFYDFANLKKRKDNEPATSTSSGGEETTGSAEEVSKVRAQSVEVAVEPASLPDDNMVDDKSESINFDVIKKVFIVGDVKESKVQKRIEESIGKTEVFVKKLDGYENPSYFAEDGDGASKKDTKIGMLFEELNSRITDKQSALVLVLDEWERVERDLIVQLETKGFLSVKCSKSDVNGVDIPILKRKKQ